MGNFYYRPINLQDIKDQLNVMKNTNSLQNIDKLMKDIDWLIKEDVGMYYDKYHELAVNYGEIRRDYDELEFKYNDLLNNEEE